jgi:hypothetical protein
VIKLAGGSVQSLPRRDVEAKVAELVGLGASVERRTRDDDPDDPIY